MDLTEICYCTLFYFLICESIHTYKFGKGEKNGQYVNTLS